MPENSNLKARFEDFLAKHHFDRQPEGLYEPIRYILSLGGKRFRPVLLLMAYQLYEERIDRGLPLALAVELFHNFTLMHDDIMDCATHRRGAPSVHERYNVNTAILSGDAMMILAYQYLQQDDLPRIGDILSIFNTMAVGVCEGQQMDMAFEEIDTVPMTDYLKMIELKTSVLLAAVLQIGALAAGGPDEDAQHLYEFGRNMGIAFQIQDDLLDAYGTAAQFGKRVGGDIIQGKKTYLFVKALELLSVDEHQDFLKTYQGDGIADDQKILAVMDYFDRLNVAEYARQTQEAYAHLAFSHLDAVQLDAERKMTLHQFAQKLIDRNI